MASAFASPGRQDQDRRRALEDRERERDPARRRLGRRHGNRCPIAHLQGGALGEERCRVAVRAEPQHRQVEREPCDLAGICGSGRVGLVLPAHAVNVPGRDVDAGDERVVRHPVVRLGVVGRHAALVTEPQMDMRPVDLRHRRDQLVRRPGGVAAGEGDARRPSARRPPSLPLLGRRPPPDRRRPRAALDRARRAPAARPGPQPCPSHEDGMAPALRAPALGTKPRPRPVRVEHPGLRAVAEQRFEDRRDLVLEARVLDRGRAPRSGGRDCAA